MVQASPVIDITSLNGVESLFRAGTPDPWGPRLAGRFADLFVYSDVARFTMPISEGSTSLSDPSLPHILGVLESRDHGLFVPINYPVEERRLLHAGHLDEAFKSFESWAQNNKSPLRKWLRLHNEAWIRDGHLARVRPRYVFKVHDLSKTPAVNHLASSLGVEVDDILYAFDVVLRYPLYGELAGPDAYFLAHPIRELQSLPTMTVDPKPPPSIPLSLSDAVRAMVPNMTLESYTAFLHEARGIIRDRKIHILKPGGLDREAIREVAAKLRLPPRLTKVGKVMGAAAGVIGAIGAVPAVGQTATVMGGLVSVAAALWTGTVPCGLSRMSWLRWAFKWDVEKQAGDL